MSQQVEVIHFLCVTSVAHFFILWGIYMKRVNERIRKIRRKLKYKQYEVARLFNTDPNNFSKRERMGTFDGEELVMLADFFKVDVREFLYDNIDAIKPHVIIPDECYLLNDREGHIITMYRNSSKEKQKEIFAFVFNTFKNK